MAKGIIAIVPAAGIGKRFGYPLKKTFYDFHGKPLLIHTLKRLNEADAVREIIPVLAEEDTERGFELFRSHGLGKIKRIAPGGKERQDSVYSALRMVRDEGLIMIHDGVRPFFSNELIKKLIIEPTIDSDIDGVVPGMPMKETLKEVTEDGVVVSTINRERFRSIQTPQVFRFDIIIKAYEEAYKKGIYATDDSALVERIGGKVKVIPGDPFNIKITTPEDKEIAEYILSKVAIQN